VFRRWLLVLTCCVIATAGSLVCLDYPLADFFAAHVALTAVGLWLNRLLGPLVIFPVAALLVLFACGCWRIAGRRFAQWTRPVLLCSWSATWALAAELAFKQIFSRLPNGGPHAGQFPSGTAAISIATATTIWLITTRLRIPAAILAAFCCAGVVVTNGHWLSDVVGGGFLGWSIGLMTVRLQQQNADPDAG